MQELSEGGGKAGQYSPGVPAALTQIVHYSASLYTVFHSVFYNSVDPPYLGLLSIYSIYGYLGIQSEESQGKTGN